MANRFAIEAVFKGIDKMTAPVRKMGGAIATFSRRAKARLHTVAKSVGKIGGAFVQAAKKASLIGGVALGAVGLLIKKVANAGDELAKFGRVVGFTVEELQEWRHVAGLAGLTNEEFTKGLRTFNKNLGEAKLNTGAMVTVVKKFDKGFLQQLKTTKDTEKAMQLVIDRLRAMKDPALKAALANAAFGRAGAKMINVADNSAAAIRRQRGEMQKLGTISQKSAEDSEAFNDMLSRLFKSFMGVAQVVAGQLIPVLTPMVEQLTELVVGLRPEIEAWAKAFVATLPERLESMKQGFSELVEFGRDLVSVFREVVSLSRAVGGTFGAAKERLGQIGSSIGLGIADIADVFRSDADAPMVAPSGGRGQTVNSTVTIKDQTGRAEPEGKLPPGVSLEVSGAFP
jgi:hypothetical protein